MPNKHLALDQIAEIQSKHELTMKSAQNNTMVAAPMTLDPTEIPLAVYQTLPSVMPLFNLLIDRIARDSDYLLKEVGPTDVFSRKMAEIVRKVYTDENPFKTPDGKPLCQNMMLGLLRSDYLFDEKAANPATDFDDTLKESFVKTRVPPNHGWKQVEINTIASSFPALSTRTGLAYEEIKKKLLETDKDNAIGKGTINVSTSERDVVNALDRSHRQFCSSYPSEASATNSKLSPVIVFLVQEGERNVGDQSLLRQGLEKLGIRVVRKSLVDLNRDLELEEKTHFSRLRVRSTDDGGDVSFTPEGTLLPVSVFYFRGLYDYDEYEKYPDFAWQVRLKVEQTMSIKCPSVPYHMCTWKIIQKQLFSEPGLLQRFIPDAHQAAVLKNFMVPHYTLGNYETDEELKKLIQGAIQDPHSFIVKTLKEGYGFILDGQEMVDNLKRLIADDESSDDEAEEKKWKEHFSATHLLVYRINSKSRAGAILKNGELHEYDDLEGEFGTYGAILTDEGGRVIFNLDAGYVVRTKSKSNMGGGVMSGVSALDAVEFV